MLRARALADLFTENLDAVAKGMLYLLPLAPLVPHDRR